MDKLNKYKLDLQLFNDGNPVNPEGNMGNPAEPTLDDFMGRFKPEDILAHASMRSALDSQIGKRVNTAITNERTKREQEQNANLSEAEKLAKMTKEEREKYQFKKDQESFASEKAAFEHDKLVVATGNELNTLNIDPSLAEIIVGKDAEETKTRMETFTKVFNAAVEKAVENKLKGGEPMKKAPQSSNGITVESIRNMSSAEINANWDEVQKFLKQK